MSTDRRATFPSTRLTQRSTRWLLVVVSSVASALLAGPNLAGTVKLDAVSTGTFTSNWAFREQGINVGYSPWYEDSGDPLHNNYFIFDLAPLAGYEITAATLRISNRNGDPAFRSGPYCPDLGVCPYGYISPDPSETFAIWDVTTPVSVVRYGTPSNPGNTYDDPVSPNNAGIVLDLGSGIQFGSTVVTAANAGPTGKVDVVLNAAGLNYLNTGLDSGNFLRALGGSVTTLTGNVYQELLFAGSGPYTNYPDVTRRLILEVQPLLPVPVPGAAVLLLSAFAVLGATRRERGSP